MTRLYKSDGKRTAAGLRRELKALTEELREQLADSNGLYADFGNEEYRGEARALARTLRHLAIVTGGEFGDREAQPI